MSWAGIRPSGHHAPTLRLPQFALSNADRQSTSQKRHRCYLLQREAPHCRQCEATHCGLLQRGGAASAPIPRCSTLLSRAVPPSPRLLRKGRQGGMRLRLCVGEACACAPIHLVPLAARGGLHLSLGVRGC
jgi:hypothetical protein